MPESFKTCSCGEHYSFEQWRALPRTGIMDVERDYPAVPGEEPLKPIELRTCTRCGSTISKPIPYDGGSEYPPPPSRHE